MKYFINVTMKVFLLEYRGVLIIIEKTWLTAGLKQSIKLKNKLYFKSKKYSTSVNVHNYKVYINKLNSLLRKTERDHYEVLFTQNKNNLKKSWSIVKEVINKKKNTLMSNKFVINNSTISDNDIISDAFNKCYINIGPTLASKIPYCQKNPLSYIHQHISDSMYLNEVTVNEVKKKIVSLK